MKRFLVLVSFFCFFGCKTTNVSSVSNASTEKNEIGKRIEVASHLRGVFEKITIERTKDVCTKNEGGTSQKYTDVKFKKIDDFTFTYALISNNFYDDNCQQIEEKVDQAYEYKIGNKRNEFSYEMDVKRLRFKYIYFAKSGEIIPEKNQPEAFKIDYSTLFAYGEFCLAVSDEENNGETKASRSIKVSARENCFTGPYSSDSDSKVAQFYHAFAKKALFQEDSKCSKREDGSSHKYSGRSIVKRSESVFKHTVVSSNFHDDDCQQIAEKIDQVYEYSVGGKSGNGTFEVDKKTLRYISTAYNKTGEIIPEKSQPQSKTEYTTLYVTNKLCLAQADKDHDGTTKENRSIRVDSDSKCFAVSNQ